MCRNQKSKIQKCLTYSKFEHIKIFDSKTKMKISNRLEDNYHLSNKKALFYNLKFYFDYIQKDVFKVIPVTFHIKKGLGDP